MKEGKRILADPKFNVLDGSWNDRDFVEFGHALYGVMPADIYSCYEAGENDDFVDIPPHVCDSYFRHKPPRLHKRDKSQPTLAGRLYYYKENPSKVRTLHKFLVKEMNNQRAQKRMKKIDAKDAVFNVKHFITISPSGHRCKWVITTKTKDENNQPVKFPILMTIQGTDACLYGTFREVISIAGDMFFDECKMKKRVVNTPVCELSAMAR